MDEKALASKLDRILAMRGDPTTGVGTAAWAECLAEVDAEVVLRAVIDASRELLLEDWAARRKADLRPQEALDAADAWLATRSPDAVARAKAAAKECTKARSETFGYDHRVAEAARHAAWAASGQKNANLFEALETIETELLARIALMAEYSRGPEQRRALVSIVRRVVLPKEAEPEVAPAPEVVSAAPVPYSVDGHFTLGQRLLHKKFGEVTVTNVGETWIEVDVPDGSKKRLSHRP